MVLYTYMYKIVHQFNQKNVMNSTKIVHQGLEKIMYYSHQYKFKKNTEATQTIHVYPFSTTQIFHFGYLQQCTSEYCLCHKYFDSSV